MATAGYFARFSNATGKGNLLDADDKILPPKTNLDQGGAIARYSSREGHALRRIAISSRTAMATDTCTARRAMRWKSIASIAMARSVHKPRLRTSAAAATGGGRNLELQRTPWGLRQFYRENGKIYQRSMVDKDRAPWEVVQVMDSITPGNPHFNEKSRMAKTILKDGETFGSGEHRRNRSSRIPTSR